MNVNTIFANYLNLYKNRLKYRCSKVLHKILQNFQSEHSTNNLDLTLFETALRKKPLRGVRKCRCLENGDLKIFRKYIQDLAKHRRWSSLWNQLMAEKLQPFLQKASSQMFDRILNMPLIGTYWNFSSGIYLFKVSTKTSDKGS